MNATQEHLLMLLLEIDAICKKHDIEYFIDYGTTLGAIRHEGFIPWDDDIDISMTEDNYYKWVEACKTELDPAKRNYDDGRTDREHPLVFGRYVDITAARISPKFAFWKARSGQCIDIFYMMELPPDPVKKQEAIDLFFAYDEYVNFSFRHIRYRSEKVMKLYREFLEEEKKVGREAVLGRLESQIFHKHYEGSDTYLVSSARKQGPPCIVPKKCYDSVHMVDFEGHKLPIAGRYVELMNVYYEDTFDMLPAVPKQHMQMSFTGIPCEGYVKDYMQLLDKDDMLKTRQEFKNLDVEEGYRMTRIRSAYYDKLGACEVLKIRKKIKEKQIDVKACLVPGDKARLAILEDLFSDYYKFQLDPRLRYWDVCFRLDDDLTYAALFNLRYGRNDFYSIAKIMHLREINHRKMTDEIRSIWDVVLLYRKIRAQIIYKNYDKAAGYLKEGLALAPECREMQIQSLVLDVAAAKDEKEYLACGEKAQKLLERYPEDDRCMKALGDVAFYMGDRERAAQYYDWVNRNSRNGMLHLDIKKKMGETL